MINTQKKRSPRASFLNGRDDTIRTCDPLVPSEVRYQTALHPDNLLLATALIVNTLSNTLYQLMHDNFTLNKNINQAFNFWCIISMQ